MPAISLALAVISTLAGNPAAIADGKLIDQIFPTTSASYGTPSTSIATLSPSLRLVLVPLTRTSDRTSAAFNRLSPAITSNTSTGTVVSERISAVAGVAEFPASSLAVTVIVSTESNACTSTDDSSTLQAPPDTNAR